jgi:hypothetical protein
MPSGVDHGDAAKITRFVFTLLFIQNVLVSENPEKQKQTNIPVDSWSKGGREGANFVRRTR